MTLAHGLVALAAMLGAGVAAGFAAGLFGIGGGFVVVPALFAVLPLLGGDGSETAHVAIGTSLATIVATSLRSVQAHARRGAVDFDLLKSWAPWVVVGVGIGLALIFGSGVALMAVHFLAPVLGRNTVAEAMPAGAARVGIAGGLGAFSSLLGIGGGTIAVIVMTMCGKSIHRAIATASGLGFIIAVPGTIGFVAIGAGAHGLPWGSFGFVNLPAALLLTSMSMLSAPWGAAAAHALSPTVLRRAFGLYLLAIGALMIRNSLT
jgi:uncharacterized membrane protein YfcA